MVTTLLWIAAVLFGLFVVIPLILSVFFRSVPHGEIRLVSWLHGRMRIYRGPARSREMPLLSTGLTIPSTEISVDMDVTEQTADVDGSGRPRPIEVKVQASAVVSVGDSDAMIRTAANRFFSRPEADRTGTLTDLFLSTGRRAVNLLTHEQLFSARVPPPTDEEEEAALAMVADTEDEDASPVATPMPEGADAAPLAVMMRKIAMAPLADLGLVMRALHIKSVRSDVAHAQRREATAEAQANADVVKAVQTRRAKQAELETERAISDMQRELEEARVSNAALVARAMIRRQEVQAKADAERVRIEAEAAAEALRGSQFGLALQEALRITKIAASQAEGFRKVNDEIREGGESYIRYRLIEMLPQIAPAMARALAEANLVTRQSGTGGPTSAGDGITEVIQSVLAGQFSVAGAMIESGKANGGESAGAGGQKAGGARQRA